MELILEANLAVIARYLGLDNILEYKYLLHELIIIKGLI